MRILIGLLYYFLIGHVALGAQPQATASLQKCTAEKVEDALAPETVEVKFGINLPNIKFKFAERAAVTFESETSVFESLELPADGNFEHYLTLNQTNGILSGEYMYRAYEIDEEDQVPHFVGEPETWKITDCIPMQAK